MSVHLPCCHLVRSFFSVRGDWNRCSFYLGYLCLWRSCLQCFLSFGVLDRGVVLWEGLWKIVNGVTIGITVGVSVLVNLGFDNMEISDLRLSRLFGQTWLNVVDLLSGASCPKPGPAAPMFWGVKLALDWRFPNVASNYFRSSLNWFKDWSSRRLVCWQKEWQAPNKKD